MTNAHMGSIFGNMLRPRSVQPPGGPPTQAVQPRPITPAPIPVPKVPVTQPQSNDLDTLPGWNLTGKGPLLHGLLESNLSGLGDPAKDFWTDQFEELSDPNDPRYAKGINEQYISRDWTNKGEGNDARSVRYTPKTGSWLEQLNNKYNGIIKTDYNTHGGGAPAKHSIDYSKLPTTRFGAADKIMRVTPENRGKLINKDMIYNDPNYGWITSSGNYKSGNEWVGQALMAATTAGLGGLFPALSPIISGIKGAGAIGSGKPPWSALAGAAGSYFGLPSWAKAIPGMAINQMTKPKKP